MSNINISEILLLTDVLHARLIRKAETESFFSAADMSRLISCYYIFAPSLKRRRRRRA